MKVLIIGQGDSPHNVSFIRRVRAVYSEIEVAFYPSSPFPTIPDIRRLCDEVFEHASAVQVPYNSYWDDMFANPLSRFSGSPEQLASVIGLFRPNYIQVNAIQDSGYLLEAAMQVGLTWTNFRVNLCVWGNDLFYFKGHPGHKERIRRFLQYVHLLVPESSREVSLATQLGYRGMFTAPVEATLVTEEELAARFSDVRPQKNALIVVKSSYQSNRTLNGAVYRALATCADLLHGYEIFVISPSLEDFRNLDRLVVAAPGATVKYSSFLPHSGFCDVIANARFLVALNLADGVSNTFLECCAAFTFPILSTSASMEDWNEQSSVLLLDPYDASAAADSLRGVLSRLEFVESAVAVNRRQLARYSEHLVNQVVQCFYRH